MNYDEDDGSIEAERERDAAEFIAAEDAKRREREAQDFRDAAERARLARVVLPPAPEGHTWDGGAWVPVDAAPPGALAFDVDARISSPLNGAHSGFPAVSARRRREREAFAVAVAGVDAPTWPAFHIGLERVGAQKLDGDNLQAGFKSIRDACAAWLGLDDADPRISWVYGQRIARVRDETPRARHPWRSWCRVVVAPTAELVAAELAGAEAAAPEQGDERTVLVSTKRARPMAAEPAGALVRAIELPPRAPGSAHVVVSLQRVLKASGRGNSLPAGACFVRLCVEWPGWRTAGVALRAGEIDALITALRELRDGDATRSD